MEQREGNYLEIIRQAEENMCEIIENLKRTEDIYTESRLEQNYFLDK